jgi:predicted ribosome quality control (RQC) complex YloA/Tae2 family protein
MKVIHNKETTYWIGKNAQDNWNCIQNSNPNWLWFHLDKFPSAHIIICKDNDINQEDIDFAVKLVIENSKYKFNNIGVVYCKIDNLVLGIEVGSVTFKSNNKVTKIKYIL